MAITPSKRQDRMTTLLLVLVGIVAGYLYYSQVSSNSVTLYPPLRADANDSLSQFKNINLNYQIFDSAQIKTLRTFGANPVLPGQTGKTDIFGGF